MRTRINRFGLAHRLVLHAAHHAPQMLSERLREEWLADLEYQTGSIHRLRFAIGCSWATAVISHEFQLPAVCNLLGLGRYRSLWGALTFELSARARHVLTFVVLASFEGFPLAYGYTHPTVLSGPTSIHTSLPPESTSQLTLPVEIYFTSDGAPRGQGSHVTSADPDQIPRD